METTSPLFVKYCKEVQKQREKRKKTFNSHLIEKSIRSFDSSALQLQDCALTYQNFSPLVAVFRRNAHLVENVVSADFSENKCFGDRAIKKLAKMFEVTPNLKSLNIANTGIENVGFVLVECVRSLPGLVSLDLSRLQFQCSLISSYLLVS